jgi:glycosyltransferase involved in cell wall biosynthesis
MFLPSISVITPNFNGAAYLEDAILSVERQSISIEHIVTDAGSTDGTLDILGRHPHLRWLSEPDRGQSDAINKGFLLASGDLVGWLNADDYYLPGALEAIARAAQEHPDADVIHGDCIFVDGSGKVMRSKVEHEFDPQVLLYFGCYIPSTSTFFRRRLIERGLLLDCDYRVAMDFEYFVRLARLGCRFHYVPRFIAAFRWHDDNVSLKNVERRGRERRMVQRAADGHDRPTWELEALRYWARARRLTRKLVSGNYARELQIQRRCGTRTLWMRDSEIYRNGETQRSGNS